MILSLYVEGNKEHLYEAWYSDESSHATAPKWTEVIFQPTMEVL